MAIENRRPRVDLEERPDLLLAGFPIHNRERRAERDLTIEAPSRGGYNADREDRPEVLLVRLKPGGLLAGGGDDSALVLVRICGCGGAQASPRVLFWLRWVLVQHTNG